MGKIIIQKDFFNQGKVPKIPDPKIEKITISESDKCVCEYCGNDTFKVYIKVIIDDAELICSKCNKPNN